MSKLVNHIHFVVDASGSMDHHISYVNELIRGIVKTEAERDLDQSSFITVWAFEGKRVWKHLRHCASNLALKSLHPIRCGGMTPLNDAVYDSIVNANMFIKKGPDEDATHLMYIVTDGDENSSRRSYSEVYKLIKSLDDSWTICAFVPNSRSVNYMQRMGLHAGNVEVWNTASARGMEEVILSASASYDTYTSLRSSGVRSSKSMFSVKVPQVVDKSKLQTLDNLNSVLYSVDADTNIKSFVEKVTGTSYIPGSVYYQLEKSELVQASKDIIVYEKSTGKKYGGASARAVLGIPAGVNGRVNTNKSNLDYDIFIQSKSLTRRVYPGTHLMFVKKA